MPLLKGKTGKKFGGITSFGQTTAQFRRQEKQFKRESQADTVAGIKKDLRNPFLRGAARKEGLAELRKEQAFLKRIRAKKKTTRKSVRRKTTRRKTVKRKTRRKRSYSVTIGNIFKKK